MSSVLDALTANLETELTSRLESETKPQPRSYDSGEECSFARLVHLYELVEIEDRELDRCVFEDACLHVA